MPRLQYEDHPGFPANAPVDHPHILKDDEFKHEVNTINPRLCDAVATILHKLDSKHPGALAAFFDLKVKSVKSVRYSEQGKGGAQMDLMAWRKDSTIMASMIHYAATKHELTEL